MPNLPPAVRESVGGPVEDKLGDFLNNTAFSHPAPFPFCAARRTLSNVRRPGYPDLYAFKPCKATSRVGLELRAEAFHLLQQVQFDLPNISYDSGEFGISSQSNTLREIQVVVEILW